MLTQEQIADYNALGYLVVRDVLSSAEVEELRQVTDQFVDQSRQATSHTDVFDLEPGHTPESPKLRRLKNPSKQHPVYDRILRHPRILAHVERLIGRTLRCNGEKLNMKQPEHGSAVEWHQDWAFYPHTNDDLLAVGVVIDDMVRENGCLLVIPESHRGPLLDHHQDGVFIGAVTDPAFDASAAVPVETPAGSITLHHARLLHGSLPNHSDKPRRLLLYQYCAGDAWPLTGMNSWEEFANQFIQGAPPAMPRLTAVPVRIPLPLPQRTGSIYEIQSQIRRSTFAGKTDKS